MDVAITKLWIQGKQETKLKKTKHDYVGQDLQK